MGLFVSLDGIVFGTSQASVKFQGKCEEGKYCSYPEDTCTIGSSCPGEICFFLFCL